MIDGCLLDLGDVVAAAELVESVLVKSTVVEGQRVIAATLGLQTDLVGSGTCLDPVPDTEIRLGSRVVPGTRPY